MKQSTEKCIFFNYIVNRKIPKSKEAKWLMQYFKGTFTSLYKTNTNLIIVSEDFFFKNVFHSLENRGVLICCEGSKTGSGIIGNVDGHLYCDGQVNALHMKTLFKDKESPYYIAFSYPDNDKDEMYLNAIQQTKPIQKIEDFNTDIDLDDPEANYQYLNTDNELTISTFLENILYKQEKARLEQLIEDALSQNDKNAFLSHTKALNSLEKPACLYQVIK